MRKNKKRQVAWFFSSFVITACFIALVFSMAVVHKNTLSAAENSALPLVSVQRENDEIYLTLNGKKYDLSAEKINDFLKSRAAAGLGVLWLLL